MKESTLVKHKLVIDAYLANGMNGTKAYKEIYGSTDDVAAVEFNRILRNPNLTEYLAEKQKEIAEKQEITLESVFKEIRIAQSMALKQNNPGVFLKGAVEKAKIAGFYETHNKQKATTVNNILPELQFVKIGVEE